jgi:hypothetical protein
VSRWLTDHILVSEITVSFVEATYSFSEGVLNHQINVVAVALQLVTNVQIKYVHKMKQIQGRCGEGGGGGVYIHTYIHVSVLYSN